MPRKVVHRRDEAPLLAKARKIADELDRLTLAEVRTTLHAAVALGPYFEEIQVGIKPERRSRR